MNICCIKNRFDVVKIIFFGHYYNSREFYEKKRVVFLYLFGHLISQVLVEYNRLCIKCVVLNVLFYFTKYKSTLHLCKTF